MTKMQRVRLLMFPYFVRAAIRHCLSNLIKTLSAFAKNLQATGRDFN